MYIFLVAVLLRRYGFLMIFVRNKTSVKPFLVVSSIFVAISFLLMGASNVVGIYLGVNICHKLSGLTLNRHPWTYSQKWLKTSSPGWVWHQAHSPYPRDCPLLQRGGYWGAAGCRSCRRNARGSCGWLRWQSSNSRFDRWPLVVLVGRRQICVQGCFGLPCWAVWL